MGLLFFLDPIRLLMMSIMRNFAMALDSGKRDSSLMAFRPRDFTLYSLGSFNTETGVINSAGTPVAVCSGSSLVNKES